MLMQNELFNLPRREKMIFLEFKTSSSSSSLPTCMFIFLESSAKKHLIE